jgi:3-hydroxybutyryl-CoA dehydrogenase
MSDVTTVGVIGAGFMGSGIAESAARAGIAVFLHEPSADALDASRARLQQSVDRAVSRGKTSAEDGAALIDRIRWTTELEDLSTAQIVVEAVVEDLAVKQDIFRRADVLLPNAKILASNTSSIPIAQLAAATTRPDRVCGLHFFSPVPVMNLVEIVIGLDSSADAIALADGFCGQISKQAIHTKDRSGFIVNFLLVPYLMAAVRMYEDGFATREDIDQGMVLGCGHPMGPLTLADFIGLDVLYAIGDSLYDEFKQPEYAPPPLLKRMLAAGRLGRKSGHGFYEYAPAREAVTA